MTDAAGNVNNKLVSLSLPPIITDQDGTLGFAKVSRFANLYVNQMIFLRISYFSPCIKSTFTSEFMPQGDQNEALFLVNGHPLPAQGPNDDDYDDNDGDDDGNNYNEDGGKEGNCHDVNGDVYDGYDNNNNNNDDESADNDDQLVTIIMIIVCCNISLQYRFIRKSYRYNSQCNVL